MSDTIQNILVRLESSEVAEVMAAAAELEALFEAQRGKLVTTCARLVGNQARAEELAQEAMTIAYGKLSEYRGEPSFSSWLYGIARNLAWRSNGKRRELLLTDRVLSVDDAAAGAVTGLLPDEREKLIEAAIAGLTPQEQEAVRLRYVEGFTQDEITDRMGLEGRSGARGLLQRCRRKLGRELRLQLEIMGHGSSVVQPL